MVNLLISFRKIISFIYPVHHVDERQTKIHRSRQYPMYHEHTHSYIQSPSIWRHCVIRKCEGRLWSTTNSFEAKRVSVIHFYEDMRIWLLVTKHTFV